MSTISDLPSPILQHILEESLHLEQCLFVNKNWSRQVKNTLVHKQFLYCLSDNKGKFAFKDEQELLNQKYSFLCALKHNYLSMIKYITRKYSHIVNYTHIFAHLIDYIYDKHKTDKRFIDDKYLDLIMYIVENGGYDQSNNKPLILIVKSSPIITYLLKTQKYKSTILIEILEKLPSINRSLECCHICTGNGINPTRDFLKNVILYARLDLYHCYKNHFTILTKIDKLKWACLSGSIDMIILFSSSDLLCYNQTQFLNYSIESKVPDAFNYLWNLNLRSNLNNLLYLASEKSTVAMMTAIIQKDQTYKFAWDECLLRAYNQGKQLHMESLIRCGANLVIRNGFIMQDYNENIDDNKLKVLAQLWAVRKYKHLVPELEKYWKF